MTEWLPEQLETIKNLCDIALVIIRPTEFIFPQQGTHLATILEKMQEEIQVVVLENCVKE